MTNRDKIAYFESLMEAATIELRSIFTSEELAVLNEILGKLSAEPNTIWLLPTLISGSVERAFALRKYALDGDKLLKKLKNLNALESLWLIDKIKNQIKTA